MIKTLKMEAFITLKNKMWWLLIILSTFFITMFTVMTHYSIDDKMQQVMMGTNQIIVENGEILEKTFLDYCESIICSDAILMFVTIFSVLLSLQEYQYGYIKNIWGIFKHERDFIISKMVMILMYVILQIILSCLIVGMCNVFLLKAALGDNISDFFVMCIQQVLLELAFGTVIMAISLFVRKIIGVLIASIIYVAFIQNLLYQAIDLIINKIGKFEVEFEIGNYLIYGNIERITMSANMEDGIRACIIAFIFIIVAFTMAWLGLKKRDVA